MTQQNVLSGKDAQDALPKLFRGQEKKNYLFMYFAMKYCYILNY